MKFFEPGNHGLTDNLYMTIEGDTHVAFNGKEVYNLVDGNNNTPYRKCHNDEFVYEIIIKKLIKDISRHGISIQRCEMLRMFASFL